jgi:hypothetical protein
MQIMWLKDRRRFGPCSLAENQLPYQRLERQMGCVGGRVKVLPRRPRPHVEDSSLDVDKVGAAGSLSESLESTLRAV